MSSDESREGQRTVVKQKEETMRALEDKLRNPEKLDPELLKKLKESQRKWAEIIQPAVEAISASERLTKEDLAVRINTKD